MFGLRQSNAPSSDGFRGGEFRLLSALAAVMNSNPGEPNAIDDLRRMAAETRRWRRRRPDRRHDRLMVAVWIAIYLPLLGTLVFMALN